MKRRRGLPDVVQLRTTQRGQRTRGGRARFSIGVAFEANETHLGAREHPRIGGTVGFVTRDAPRATGACSKTNGPRLSLWQRKQVGSLPNEDPHAFGHVVGVGIVAIGAGHRAFGQAMLVRFLKRSPNRNMAGRTLGIDFRRLTFNQLASASAVDGVALRAADGFLSVARHDASKAGGVVQVTGEANLVGFGRRQLRGLADVFRVGAIGVLSAGPVAGLAGLRGPSGDLSVSTVKCRRFCKAVVDFFVADFARVGSGIAGFERGSRGCLWRGSCGGGVCWAAAEHNRNTAITDRRRNRFTAGTPSELMPPPRDQQIAVAGPVLLETYYQQLAKKSVVRMGEIAVPRG